MLSATHKTTTLQGGQNELGLAESAAVSRWRVRFRLRTELERVSMASVLKNTRR